MKERKLVFKGQVVLSVLLIGSMFASSKCFAEDLFAPAVNYPSTIGIPHGLSNIEVGDWNEDGHIDLATIELKSTFFGTPAYMAIFLNNGDGTFSSPPSVIHAGQRLLCIVKEDFNGDGHLDLAMSNENNNSNGGVGQVTVVYGNGDGTFSAPVPFNVANRPLPIVAGDWDGDGDIDLATGHGYGHVSLLFNNGVGDFSNVVIFSTGGSFWTMEAADFDEDNDRDLALIDTNSNQVWIYLNDGSGHFSHGSSSTPLGIGAIGSTVGDWDGDGDPDLAVNATVPDNVYILINDGSASFTVIPIHLTGSVAGLRLAQGDFDLSGSLDIAVSLYDRVGVLLNDGNGNFTFDSTYPTDTYSKSIEAADFNGDGKIDLAAADGSTNNVSILFNIANSPPTANAGPNLIINSDEQGTTIIQGTASDPDNDPLTCRWLERAEVLEDWTDVTSGQCPLDLGTVSPRAVGEHTLTLEVSDGKATATDDMVLTVNNSPPTAAPTGGGTVEIFTPITLEGQVSDYDGDTLSYKWIQRGNPDVILFGGIIETPFGGAPVTLTPFIIDDGLPLGTYTISLVVNDGINAPVSEDISVTAIDSTAPTVSVSCLPTILWPPNHELVPITVGVLASDNSGSVSLDASVTSDDPINAEGDGNTEPDAVCEVTGDPVNPINLSLRAERQGTGDGRTYTTTITATDPSGNASSASCDVIAPHDRGKKK